MGKTKNKPKKNGKAKTKSLPEVLTLAEAAEFLRMDEAAMERLASSGQIRGRNYESLWRFSKRSLMAWIERGEPDTTATGLFPPETPEEQAAYWEAIMKNRDEMDRLAQCGKYAPE